MSGGGKWWKEQKRCKDATNQPDKDAEMEVAEAAMGKRQLIKGQRQCKRCGELGHGETSCKCNLNVRKKRYQLV